MTEEVRLIRIESNEFGRMVIDGKTYKQDIIISANGNVIYRTDISERKYGTHHIICTEEIKLILQDKPRVIVLGTGQYGACRIEKDIKNLAEKQNVKLFIEKTQKAVEIFNKIKERKAGLFHLTC